MNKENNVGGIDKVLLVKLKKDNRDMQPWAN